MLSKVCTQFVLALVAAGLLADCSSVENLIPHVDPLASQQAASQASAGANPRPVAQLPSNPAEKPIVLPVSSIDINCPEVEIAEGGSAYRAGGAESASVRYQFNIGETARQCDPAGQGEAAIKVGVSGNLVIGQAGSPGTYSVPLRITVTEDASHKQVYSKTYAIQATADAVSLGQFRIVADPIVVPMPTLQLASLYTVTVGFEGGGGGGGPPRRHKRKAAG